MGGLVVGLRAGNCHTLAVGGRETSRAGTLGKTLRVALTTLLGETSTKDGVGAEDDGGED